MNYDLGTKIIVIHTTIDEASKYKGESIFEAMISCMYNDTVYVMYCPSNDLSITRVYSIPVSDIHFSDNKWYAITDLSPKWPRYNA